MSAAKCETGWGEGLSSRTLCKARDFHPTPPLRVDPRASFARLDPATRKRARGEGRKRLSLRGAQRRSNPSYRVKEEWIASSLSLLAMTARHSSAFSRRVPPEFCHASSAFQQKAQGMPGAGAPAAARVLVVSTRVSHHGHTGNTRHSPRNGFNGVFRALPGDRALLPPSPLRSFLLKNLMPASGHQDHTTSPSA